MPRNPSNPRSINFLNRNYVNHGADGEGTENLNYVALNTVFTPNDVPVGMFYWNSDEMTIDLRVDTAVTLQVGQEVLFNVKNQTGSTITNGTPVMFAGTLGNSGRILIQPAIADYSLKSSYIMGIATEDIVDGADGKVTWFGKVRGINTTGTPYSETWSDGDVLYISQSTVGYLTNVRPTSGQLIEVAAVIHATTSGTLFIRPTWFDKDSQTVTKTADYTILGTESDGETNILVDASSNDVSITLPSASVLSNRFTNITRIDDSNNDVTIVGTVSGTTNPIIGYQYSSGRIVSDGTNYYFV